MEIFSRLAHVRPKLGDAGQSFPQIRPHVTQDDNHELKGWARSIDSLFADLGGDDAEQAASSDSIEPEVEPTLASEPAETGSVTTESTLEFEPTLGFDEPVEEPGADEVPEISSDPVPEALIDEFPVVSGEDLTQSVNHQLAPLC